MHLMHVDGYLMGFIPKSEPNTLCTHPLALMIPLISCYLSLKDSLNQFGSYPKNFPQFGSKFKDTCTIAMMRLSLMFK